MEEIASFYLIYSLNLVDFGLMELKEKWAIHYPNQELNVLSVDDGGILISVTMIQGFSLNHLLRTPTRILLRVAEFKARDFPKLFQKISKLPLKHLMIGGTPKVEVAATTSRLFDSRKIEKAIHDGLLEAYKKQPVKKKYLDHLAKLKAEDVPELYYRAVDDVITLSFDTTGEILHKRGDKVFTGLAPIRENLGSLLLKATINDLPLDKQYTLIDPMCGSGTFLIEGHDSYHVNFERSFSYEHTPLWIDYNLKKEFASQFTSKNHPLFSHYEGIEINEDVIAMAKKNTGNRKIDIIQGDIFDDVHFPVKDSVVIINPPYGLRVGIKDQINARYYEEIISKVKTKFSPKRLGIIIPEEHHFHSRFGRIIRELSFRNGGLPVKFFVLDLEML